MNMVFISEDIRKKKVKTQWMKTFVNYISDQSTAYINSCCNLMIKVGPIKKNRQRICMDISLKMGKWSRRCSTSSVGNANKTPNEILLYNQRRARINRHSGLGAQLSGMTPLTATATAREERPASVDEGIENLVILWQEMKWCSCFGKQFSNSSKIKY